MYLHLGGTHVHHLNYGIFLLAAVGGVPVAGPSRRVDDWQDGTLYGVGLALTFDEFGLWLHVDSFKYADRLLLRVQIIEPSRPPLPS